MNALDIPEHEARGYAYQIIDFFGFEDRIIDNLLKPEERRLFYRLEQQGIITSRREEATLHNGNPWRIHYWRLERKSILEYAKHQHVSAKKSQSQDSSCESIYAALTQDMWSARHTS